MTPLRVGQFYACFAQIYQVLKKNYFLKGPICLRFNESN